MFDLQVNPKGANHRVSHVGAFMRLGLDFERLLSHMKQDPKEAGGGMGRKASARRVESLERRTPSECY